MPPTNRWTLGSKPSRVTDGSATDWLATSKVGFGSGQAGVFTSGGTQSNLMGVLLTRDWCIAKNYKNDDGSEWSVQRDGIPADAMQKVKVICSENAHFSVQKHGNDGHGFQSVVTVPVNDQAQMDVAALEHTMAQLKAEGKIIACVVATAGTTDAGAIDLIPAIRKPMSTVHGFILMPLGAVRWFYRITTAINLQVLSKPILSPSTSTNITSKHLCGAFCSKMKPTIASCIMKLSIWTLRMTKNMAYPT